MRFIDYLKLSSLDDDIAKFRALSIKLVKEDTNYKEIVHNNQMLVSVKEEIDTILSSLNTELKKVYNGTYKFDLCVYEGKPVDTLKLKSKYIRNLTLNCYESNDKLSKIKKEIENLLTKNDDKKNNL